MQVLLNTISKASKANRNEESGNIKGPKDHIRSIISFGLLIFPDSSFLLALDTFYNARLNFLIYII